jgi:hypothetical protein
MTMNCTHLLGLGALAALAIGSLAGCGAPNDNAALGPLDESVGETSAALTTATFTLHNYQTGYCLGVAAGTPTIGTRMVVWTCDTSANQNWVQGSGPYAGGYVQLINGVATDRCLRGTNGVWIDFANQGAWTEINHCGNGYDGDTNWLPIYVGQDFTNHECYRFKELNIQGVLGVLGGNTSRGASAVTWHDFANQYTHPDQIWCVY